MTVGFSGRGIVLSRGNADGPPETFTVVAAAREHTVTENEQEVDITTKPDEGQRQLLSGAILRSVAITYNGVFTDDASLANVRADFTAGLHSNYQVDVLDTEATNSGYLLTGPFRVTQFEASGAHDGEVSYSVTMASSGDITVS